MLKRILLLIAIGCSCLNAFSQFFIPIIIPYSVESYVCNTKNILAREHYQEANNNFHTNVSLSVSYYSEAIKLDSFFCDAYYGLVKSYNKLKYYNNAMEITNLALKINSIQPWFMKQKGILYLRLKEYQSAADYFEKMIEVQPREASWYYYYAESLIKLGQLDKAMKYTIEMEYIMSQQEDWDSNIASFYLQGKIAYYNQEFEKARKAFRVIKSKYRRNGDFCYHYGLALMKLNEPNKAKRFINKAIHLGYDDINKDEVKSLNI